MTYVIRDVAFASLLFSFFLGLTIGPSDRKTLRRRCQEARNTTTQRSRARVNPDGDDDDENGDSRREARHSIKFICSSFGGSTPARVRTRRRCMGVRGAPTNPGTASSPRTMTTWSVLFVVANVTYSCSVTARRNNALTFTMPSCSYPCATVTRYVRPGIN